MRTQIRLTKCPLCGSELGMVLGDEWTPMTLDEYRDYSATQIIPHPRTTSAPDACIVCWTPPGDAANPRPVRPTLPATLADSA